MASGGEAFVARLAAIVVFGIVGTIISWLFGAAKNAVTDKSNKTQQNKELEQFDELDKFRQQHQGEAEPNEKNSND